MRITNKIMNNNSMYNINNNKVAEDTVSTQMATGKKINRPSEDPVIAIRALRLRSTVTQLDQYYQKNAKDAKSWMEVTEDSLSTITDVLTDAIQQVNRGANKDLTLDDLNTIITQLEALSAEYYSTGNVDYAGRYIFTGYRTDTTLSYSEPTTENFTGINDEFNAEDLSRSIRTLNLHQLDAGNVLNTDSVTGDYISANKEIDITQVDVGRIRLSYDNLDYTEGENQSAELKFRENLRQSATSSITQTDLQIFNMTYTTADGIEHKAYVPLLGDPDQAADYDTKEPDYVVRIDEDTVEGKRYIEYTNAKIIYKKDDNGDYLVDDNGKKIFDHYEVTAKDYKENPKGSGNYDESTYVFHVTEDGVIGLNDDGNMLIYDGEDAATRHLITDKEGADKDYYAMAQGITSMSTTSVSTLAFSDSSDPTLANTTATIPLIGPIGQQYTITLNDSGFTGIVNSDGTFTLEKTTANNDTDHMGPALEDEYGNAQKTVLQVTANGSIHASYTETTLVIDADHIIYSTTSDADIDTIYTNLKYGKDILPDRDDPAYNDPGLTDAENEANYNNAYAAAQKLFENRVYLNAKTGEVILSDYLNDKLTALQYVNNTNTIDIVYDKKEWQNGDIRPQNLFACVDSKGVLYNGGTSDHEILYDVGYSQKIRINTMANSVFSTTVKRDVYDLQQYASKINTVSTTLKTLKDKLEKLTDADERQVVQNEIDATQKAYDYLRENIQEEFEHKITSIQRSLDKANVAVTDNGARSKRLELITTRLQDQTTTFKNLQSDNEDADLAETATNLATAQLTYQAALMATGKIGKDSLMNYI